MKAQWERARKIRNKRRRKAHVHKGKFEKRIRQLHTMHSMSYTELAAEYGLTWGYLWYITHPIDNRPGRNRSERPDERPPVRIPMGADE
jgi:hypothetical protein